MQCSAKAVSLRSLGDFCIFEQQNVIGIPFIPAVELQTVGTVTRRERFSPPLSPFTFSEKQYLKSRMKQNSHRAANSDKLT